MAAAKETGNPSIAERAYDTAIESGQAQQAKQALNLIRELDPNSLRLSYERALDQIMEGKHSPEQTKALLDYIKGAKNPEKAFLKVARHTDRLTDAQLRYETLEKLAQAVPKSFRTELILGQSAASAGKHALAVKHADKAVSLSPQDVQVLLGAAEIEYMGSPKAAQKRLRTFLATHPDNLQVRLALVKTLVNHAKGSEIEKELNRIDRLGKRTAGNLMTLGALCESAKLWPRAERYYREYISLTESGQDKVHLPDTGYLRLGMTKLQSGNRQEALQWLHKVEKGDKYVPARVKEAEILATQGRVNESCAVLKNIRAKNTRQRSELISACAELLIQVRRPAEAASTMEILVAEDPNNAQALLQASYYYERADDLKKSESLLLRYIRLHPKDPQGYNSLGYMWADRGIKLDKSEQLLAKALELSGGKNPAIIDSMGWVKYRLGKLSEAEKYLRQAVQSSTDKEISMHLAQVLFARGKAAEAKAILDRILEADPDNPEVLSLLKANGFNL